MKTMQDATTETMTSEFSMRRTLLTLLGAIGAFGVLTASYATAELPQRAGVQNTVIAADMNRN